MNATGEALKSVDKKERQAVLVATLSAAPAGLDRLPRARRRGESARLDLFNKRYAKRQVRLAFVDAQWSNICSGRPVRLLGEVQLEWRDSIDAATLSTRGSKLLASKEACCCVETARAPPNECALPPLVLSLTARAADGCQLLHHFFFACVAHEIFVQTASMRHP